MKHDFFLRTYLQSDIQKSKITKASFLFRVCSTRSEFSWARGLKTFNDEITSYAVHLFGEKVAVSCFKNNSQVLHMIRKIEELPILDVIFALFSETFRSSNIDNVQKWLKLFSSRLLKRDPHALVRKICKLTRKSKVSIMTCS